jgi:glycosyltransferase involved in cell wall biosynthesis
VDAAGAELWADVADIRPAYWEASVVAVPIRLGSGVKNKVVHAAACGAPLVSTSFGVDGSGVRPGDEALVADDAADFAAAITATLADPQAAAARATRARRVAQAHHVDAAGPALEALWGEAVANATKGSRVR